MDLDLGLLELLARERLETARVQAERRALVALDRPRPRGVRVWCGLALIRLGHLLLGPAAQCTPAPRST